MDPLPRITANPGNVSVSIVVIGLNEEHTLERCLASVQGALDELPANIKKETVYVDSGSTDASVSIATRHVDEVLELTASPSASAAREAGVRHTHGEYVFFIDGDMTLDECFLAASLPLLESLDNNDIVGIQGRRDDVHIDPDTRKAQGERPNFFNITRPRKAKRLGGSFLIRREALIQAGGWRPDVFAGGHEELDLYARLLDQDQWILELPIPFITHHDDRPRNTLTSWAKTHFAFDGPRVDAGTSFVRGFKEPFLKGLIKLFPWIFATWLVDAITLSLLFIAPLYALILQGAWAIASLATNQGTEWINARLWLYGTLVAAFRLGQTKDDQPPTDASAYRTVSPQTPPDAPHQA